MKKNKILNISIITLIIVFALVIVSEQVIISSQKKQQAEAEKQAMLERIPTDENSINILPISPFESNDEGQDVFLSYENFLKDYSRTSYHIGDASVTYRPVRNLVSGGNDIYVLGFKMRAEETSAKVDVKFGTEHTYYVTTEWREYFMPCVQGEIDSISWKLTTPFQKIYFTDIRILRYDPLKTNYRTLKNGSYAVEPLMEYNFSEYDGIKAGASMDVASDGNYLYTAGEEMLKIFDISDGKTELVSTMQGVGNIRHLEIKDKNIIAAASRENGIYLVNIQNKKAPFIECYYDSLEIANDVCFSGNYMFVAGRYFGVEIVDVSDVKNPVYIDRVYNNKEYFRCTTKGQYLFVSGWATSDVEIYDVSLIDEPKLVSTVTVDGRCAEAFVDGNNLYIASGYKSVENSDAVGNPGYSTGNGLTVYDISTIEKPVWCSTIKTEGSLYGNGYDDWSVCVSDGYAYFTNSFGGMYIYDVKNPSAPVAEAFAGAKILPGSENYIGGSKNERVVYPYDGAEYVLSAAMGVCVTDGRVFFAGAHSDVYEFNFEHAKPAMKKTGYEHKRNKAETAKENEYEIYLNDEDVYAIAEYVDMYAVATADGVYLLDENMAVLDIYETQLPVKDIKTTKDGFIITAETNGVGVYTVNDKAVVKIGFAVSNAKNHNVSSIGVTGDGKFAITQSSWTKYEAFDLRDKYNPSLLEQVISSSGTLINIENAAISGNMYYRNIISGTLNDAVGIAGGSNVIWFESRGDNLAIKAVYSNDISSEVNGHAVLDDEKVLSLYVNGFSVYNPFALNGKKVKDLERYYASGSLLKGKISIADNMLVICNHPAGLIQIVDITDYARPYLHSYYQIDDSIGIGLSKDGAVLIPVRHGGIMKIDLNN